MIREKRSVTMQAQMNTRWLAPDLDTDGNEQFDVVHILLSMYPDLDENDEVDTVMVCCFPDSKCLIISRGSEPRGAEHFVLYVIRIFLSFPDFPGLSFLLNKPKFHMLTSSSLVLLTYRG
jgi:hypothetical protein